MEYLQCRILVPNARTCPASIFITLILFCVPVQVFCEHINTVPYFHFSRENDIRDIGDDIRTSNVVFVFHLPEKKATQATLSLIGEM